jgi:hypothetical protein
MSQTRKSASVRDWQPSDALGRKKGEGFGAYA